MTKFEVDSYIKGDIGESFVQWWCSIKYKSYKKATLDENRLLGIDCYIDNVPTDIKSTNKIVLGKYDNKYKKFMTRHPFKKETKSEQYCIVNLHEAINKFHIENLCGITPYLTTRYFNDITAVDKAKEILEKYNFKTYQEANATSIANVLYSIKLDLQPLLKRGVVCKYDETEENKDNYMIYLFIP